jgi:hypothetical protein
MDPSREEREERVELPNWIFDIDDEDESATSSRTLFQELEIDPGHIYRNVMWMLFGPCYRLVGRPYKRHPLHASSSANNRRGIDFWGPCAAVSIFSLILWLGRVREVPWIYLVWAIAAVVNHMVSRVWFHSSLMIHVALLGYATVPLIPFALLIILVNPPVWISTTLEIISIIWASLSAITSYATIITVPAEPRVRLRLLYPTAIIMSLYLTSLLPTGRK